MRVSVGMRSETIAPRAGGRSGNPSADADLPAGLRPGAVHEDEGGLPLGEPDDRHRLALDADPRDAVLLDENAGERRRAESTVTSYTTVAPSAKVTSSVARPARSAVTVTRPPAGLI